MEYIKVRHFVFKAYVPLVITGVLVSVSNHSELPDRGSTFFFPPHYVWVCLGLNEP